MRECVSQLCNRFCLVRIVESDLNFKIRVKYVASVRPPLKLPPNYINFRMELCLFYTLHIYNIVLVNDKENCGKHKRFYYLHLTK